MATLEPWFFKYNAWSYSKHRLFNLCKRSYYYRYIGTALKESNDVDIFKLKRLKGLNSRYFLEGLLIHAVIETQIRQHYIGHDLNEVTAKEQFIQQVERYRKTASEVLTEFYNGLPVDNEFFNRIRESGQNKISTFFSTIWPQVKDLEYLKHEDFEKYKINEVDVIVKVDYVSRTKNDVIVIIDWKTGTDREEYERDLQIGTYVLWAMQYYGKDSTQIKSELMYLKTGMTSRCEFSSEDLERIRTIILEDFKNMNTSYEIKDYPAFPDPRKCMSCQFGSICLESMKSKSCL